MAQGRSRLTPRQQLFAHKYVELHGNATEAAKAAGYSRRTAYAQGSRLLKHAETAGLIGRLEAKQFSAIDATAEDVKRELARIAKADVSRAFDENGQLLPLHQIPEDVRRAISGFEVDGTVRKLKFWSKPEALGLLAKHHGLLREIIEVADVTETRDITDEEWNALSRLEHEVRGG